MAAPEGHAEHLFTGCVHGDARGPDLLALLRFARQGPGRQGLDLDIEAPDFFGEIEELQAVAPQRVLARRDLRQHAFQIIEFSAHLFGRAQACVSADLRRGAAEDGARQILIDVELAMMEYGDIDEDAPLLREPDGNIGLHVFVGDVVLLVQRFRNELTDLFSGGIFDFFLASDDIDDVTFADAGALLLARCWRYGIAP